MSVNYATVLQKAYNLINVPEMAGVSIQIGRTINSNVNLCPWVGIYPGAATYEPAALGMADNMDADVSIEFVVQVIGGEDAIKAEERMMEIVDIIFNNTLSSTSWDGVLELITGFETNPGIRPVGDGDVNFRETVITLNATVTRQ